ncbi:divalent-cation tolerance protein CutA [Streptomyces sp. NPDC053048]|uniref:divalent-cation tolerance protein CutA n=1 Tax=Streptomyces sp. NPDC053048 TaxID=3365694 RepID=UPI0037CE4C4B
MPETEYQPEYLVVVTTTDSHDRALRLATTAVEARLAACAQIEGPITSVYRWEGAVETAREWRVVYKTAGDRYAALEAHIRDEHDYDVPEVVATPVTAGSAAYLAWTREQTRG